MAQESHRGSKPSVGLWSADRRVDELDRLHLSSDPSRLGDLRDVKDRYAAGIAAKHRRGQGAQFHLGTVVQAVPHLNWYRVLTTDLGVVGALQISETGTTPDSIRSASMATPGSAVLLCTFPGLPYAISLGPLPSPVRDTIALADQVFQGSQTGFRREQVHSWLLKNAASLSGFSGAFNFSAGRPTDQTPYEWGKISSTGIAILLDKAMAQLRVNEACGVFLSYFDSYMRLAGLQIDLNSMVSTERLRNDEGESHLFRGVATYPYEALGLYAPGTSFVEKNHAADVQYRTPRGSSDLPSGSPDVDPLYRWQEWGGYLGQGHIRTLIRPADTRSSRSRRTASDGVANEALFLEAISGDGAVTIASTKSVGILKRSRLVGPRQVKKIEDAAGDDGRRGDYRFSGQFGGLAGDSHVVSDLRASGDLRSWKRAAAVNDWIAYALNWKILHAFAKHERDYLLPQESESGFQANAPEIDFGELAQRQSLRDPLPTTLQIDPRYAEVDYYLRESGLLLHDDGAVHLFGGAGEEIVMGGGKLRLSAPIVEIYAPKQLVILAGETVIRSHGSLDVSSGKDVRIKADGNGQIVAGVSGKGGLLLEGKGEGADQDYEDRIGEDVVGSGVVVRASAGVSALIGQSVYVRTELGTGRAGSTGGEIVLDAAQGQGLVRTVGQAAEHHYAESFSIWFGAVEETPPTTAGLQLDADRAVFGGDAAVQKLTVEGDAYVDGDVKASGSVHAGGTVYDRRGSTVSQVSSDLANSVRDKIAEQAAERIRVQQQGETSHADLVAAWYAALKPGNADVLRCLAFSWRDDDAQAQHKTQDFSWPEPRLMQMLRDGRAKGGKPWVETPVLYQGRLLYPWPGRKHWTETASLLSLASHRFYDPATGRAKDRPYTESEAADWDRHVMADALQTL